MVQSFREKKLQYITVHVLIIILYILTCSIHCLQLIIKIKKVKECHLSTISCINNINNNNSNNDSNGLLLLNFQKTLEYYMEACFHHELKQDNGDFFSHNFNIKSQLRVIKSELLDINSQL